MLEDVVTFVGNIDGRNYRDFYGKTLNVVGDVRLHCYIHSQWKSINFVEVKGDFICRNCNLTTLEFSPRRVEGIFDCSHNKLTSIKGCPEYVGKDFNVSYNEITQIDDFPSYVGRDVDFRKNCLTSLKGCPRVVNGSFDCAFNELTSFKDCPEIVKGYFYGNANYEVKNLEYRPNFVGYDFIVSNGFLEECVEFDIIIERYRKLKVMDNYRKMNEMK